MSDFAKGAWAKLPRAPKPVPLADLGKHGCKWPIGDAPILFCGLHTDTGKYCPAHSAIAFRSIPNE